MRGARAVTHPQKWLDSPLELPDPGGPEEIFPHADRFQFSTKWWPTPQGGSGISNRKESPFK
jgi:hypothetical protein